MKRLASLFLFLAVSAAARGDDFSKAIASIEKAWMNDDGAALSESIQVLKTLPPAPRVTYAIGYADRRLAYIRSVTKADRAAAMTEAVARFEEVVKSDPKNAEGHALLASCLGSMIGFEPGRAMELGPRAGMEMMQALMLGPNNPRVLLLAGQSTLFKPEEYGGGAEKAEPLLRQAASIFSQEPEDLPWPNWGRVEVHIWLGQLLDKIGKRDAARTEYETAAKIAPKAQWPRAMLQSRPQ
jgi:tetratricopeptide (TPR) repeat protein